VRSGLTLCWPDRFGAFSVVLALPPAGVVLVWPLAGLGRRASAGRRLARFASWRGVALWAPVCCVCPCVGACVLALAHNHSDYRALRSCEKIYGSVYFVS